MSDKTSDKKASDNKTSDKLLSCPFCGGEAIYYRTPVKSNGGWCDSVVVKCKQCEARTARILYDARKHPNDEEYTEAAKAWNTRKPLEQIVERLGELQDDYCDRYCHIGIPSLFQDAWDEAIEIVKEETDHEESDIISGTTSGS